MRTVTIDREIYIVQEEEFQEYTHPVYNNLKLYHQLTDLERLVALIQDLSDTFQLSDITLSKLTQSSFGGYLQRKTEHIGQKTTPVYRRLFCAIHPFQVKESYDFVLTPHRQLSGEYTSFEWKTSTDQWWLHVHHQHLEEFRNKYHWYLSKDEQQINFDNLIHLVMIVKNAGDTFKEVLEKNILHIDRWTILDTGSTDNTIQIIQDTLVPKVRGELFQEPFIDFGKTRNRALELAGQVCKFTLMLDDTYYVDGDLRGFLNEIRSDQFADSFSLYITSNDVQYVSNRLLKTNRGLKYLFKIHEVVQDYDNKNVIVPLDRAQIQDIQSEYMQKRTIDRKTFDLQLLKQSIQEDPDNPRHYYYTAQTYIGLENWEMAYKYFLHRVYHPVEGFLQEKIDACFEAARTAQFRLNRPWEEVKPLYEKAYALDPSRPDSMYFLAIKEYLDGNRKTAYTLFKKTFEIGYPVHAQYSLKPTLSYHFTPKFLVNSLCWEFEDYSLGEQASQFYLQHNSPDSTIQSWYLIYQHLNRLPKLSKPVQFSDKPYICFVADGNWNKWSGKDLREKGLGGSETYIVEMAEQIQKMGTYKVVVFCKCNAEETYNDVEYRDLSRYYTFIIENVVHTSIISRFSEYLPVTYKSQVENVYLVVHDLTPTGVVIIRNPKLKGIFTLTEWHKSYLENIYPTLSDLMIPLYYGIHSEEYITKDKPLICSKKILDAPRFIYSSFPNRGLLILLEMWKDIRDIYPEATLKIYADLNHHWCLKHFPDEMRSIKCLIYQPGITCCGWVNSKTLTEAWQNADIWLYPCIFQETFCHTAMQAAASSTLAITSDLAALQNTVGDRGFMILGDPRTEEWRDEVLNVLRNLQNYNTEELLVRNQKWAREHSWVTQAERLIEYIDLYPLEYRGMYNWTNDIPTGSQNLLAKIVQQTLRQTICPMILEVGTFTGTGLIHLMKLLPGSTGEVIDPWKNYVEFPEMKYLNIQESFMRNLKQVQIEDRVTIYKAESQKKLVDFVREQMAFHLIMVDGSHYALDTFANLILSWDLLLPGGLLIIDDYNLGSDTLNYSYSCPSEFAVPKQAVDRFIELYRSNMKVLYKDYRVFLQKK
jgi:glycosyltransferase involved in cell wall biosynthesis/predicted O-methyltransferase YrrM